MKCLQKRNNTHYYRRRIFAVARGVSLAVPNFMLKSYLMVNVTERYKWVILLRVSTKPRGSVEQWIKTCKLHPH